MNGEQNASLEAEANESLQNSNIEPQVSEEADVQKNISDTLTTVGNDVDYAKVIMEDIQLLKEEFSELCELEDITELPDPLRYAALRDLGLTAAEAYLATAKRQKKDNRSHLISTRTVSVSHQNSMSESELAAAREIFSGVSDSEIRKLYKRVTK